MRATTQGRPYGVYMYAAIAVAGSVRIRNLQGRPCVVARTEFLKIFLRAKRVGVFFMKQKGYVISVDGNIATVRVTRGSACGGNCVSCKGCPSEAVTVECRVEGDLSVGDCAELTMPDRSFFKNVYFGYIQTTILMIAGAVCGYAVFGFDGASVLGAAAGLAVGLLLAKLVFSPKKAAQITARRYRTKEQSKG